MSIYIKQNSPKNIKLLTAQRHLYQQAKTLQRWRTIGTVGLAAIAPFVMFVFPQSKTIMGMAGGLWLLISKLIFEDIEAGKIKTAAIIQEQFDTILFDLPWNSAISGNKVEPEIISSAARTIKGEKAELENWYSDTGNIPYPGDVILCQRAGLVWDWRLRQYYAWVIGAMTAFLFIFGIVLALITNQTVIDYFLALFLPSLSALLKGIEITRKHNKIAGEKLKLEKRILTIWTTFLNDQDSVTKEHCRQIQDGIFILRSQGPLVPDKWYEWLKNRYQIDMESAVLELVKEADAVLDIKKAA